MRSQARFNKLYLRIIYNTHANSICLEIHLDLFVLIIYITNLLKMIILHPSIQKMNLFQLNLN